MFLNAVYAAAEPTNISSIRDIASENTVLLRTPPPHSQGYFVSEVLTKLYDRLGYKVQFMNVPSVRELDLAKSSVLSGVLARDRVVEESYPDLVRVDFSLFEYQVILTGDRRLCGYCLPEDITVVGYPKGLKVFPTIIKTHLNNPSVIPLTDTAKVEEVVLKQRLPAFLNANIDYSEQLKLSPHTIKHVLDIRPDFHYLSPKYAFLKPELEQGLSQMLESGELDTLKKKYGIQSFLKTDEPIKQLDVKVASGTWQEYTEPDGTGVYWGILESSLGSQVILHKEATSWVRAVRLFENNKADILLGTYKDMPTGFLTSEFHIDYESEVYAFAQDEETLKRMKNGDGDLTYCASETYELVAKRVKNASSIYETDFFMCEQLFSQKKIDILVDYEYNVPSYFETYSYDVFSESLPLFALFHDNKRGRMLKAMFDKGLAKASREKKLSQHFLSFQDYKNARISATKTN